MNKFSHDRLTWKFFFTLITFERFYPRNIFHTPHIQETFSTLYTWKCLFFVWKLSQCKYCDHKASAPQSLSTHIKSVHKGFTHDCQVCDYKIKYKHNPEQHIKTAHTKVHKCDQCDWKFTRKVNLTQHVKSVHEGIKHQCEYCSHKASTPNNLRQHVKSVYEGIG